MSAPRADLDQCHALLRRGSATFHAASRALPARLSDPVAAFYAFCRVSDDLIDEGGAPRAALVTLRARLDGIYAGRPEPSPVDRALAWAVAHHTLPRTPIDALLEGYAWDAEGRRYTTLSELLSYCARVASSVGVAMTRLMGVDDERVLARAIDLGAALQLVNVARDVGEDARRGRLYLPSGWLEREGLDVERFLAAPTPHATIRLATLRLLDHADVLGARAQAGIPYLPRDVRLAVRAAGRLYLDIGRIVRDRGGDGVTARASTGAARKAVLIAGAALEGRAARREPLIDPVLPEAAFLLG